VVVVVRLDGPQSLLVVDEEGFMMIIALKILGKTWKT